MKKLKITKKIVLKESSTTIEAIKKITIGDYRFQLVIKGEKLLGTISDGDIRRSMIKGNDLNSSVSLCMNKKPILGYEEHPEQYFSLLNSLDSLIKFLPVVDKHNNLKFVIVNDLKNFQQTEKTALIMAGGFGKRLGNKTKNTPKPLIKIKNKPILELIISKLENFNYKNIFISTHYLHNKIETFLKKRKSKANIQIIYEKKPLGTGGCLRLLPKNISENLTVINGDIISNINLDELEIFHNKRKNDITLCVAKYKNKIPFGVISFNNHQKLTSINEKPEINYFVLSGIYCLNKKIIKSIKKEKIDITDIIMQSKKTGKKIEVFPIFENWNDIGSPEDLQKLNEQE